MTVFARLVNTSCRTPTTTPPTTKIVLTAAEAAVVTASQSVPAELVNTPATLASDYVGFKPRQVLGNGSGARGRCKDDLVGEEGLSRHVPPELCTELVINPCENLQRDHIPEPFEVRRLRNHIGSSGTEFMSMPRHCLHVHTEVIASG